MSQIPSPAPLPPDQAPERVDVSAMHSPIMRENRDPKDGYEPIPLWLVSLFGILVFWGGWYLATYSGGFRSDVLDENPAAQFVGLQGPAKPEDPLALGKRLFVANCSVCHQASGLGVPGQYPPLAGSEWIQGQPARIKRIVLYGLEGPVRVKGAVYNGNMPNFALKLKDEHIAAILSYVRTNKDWGNSASMIEPESVAATRAATQGRTLPWSESELLTVHQDEYAPPTTAPAKK